MTRAVLLISLLAAAPLTAQTAEEGAAPLPVTAESVEAATYQGGDLPDGPSPLTVKVQVLLDRAGISPGVIDGLKGGMSESAIKAFESREGLPEDGVLDADVWAKLGGDAADPLLTAYQIAPEDAEGLTLDLPTDYAKMAELPALGYQSVAEELGERFHMDEDFLKALNPTSAFEPGEAITVAAVGEPVEAEVDRIEVRKATGRLAAFDAAGMMVANYPVTVGSDSTPSPEGTVEVVSVAFEPTYHYDPDVNFQQGENAEPLVLPAGPNGPVGAIWIDLSKPTYGLHGTPEPSGLFTHQSHGCVRMTNWDATELGHMVHEGTVVEFVE